MTDKTDLTREIHEYVTTHGGENTATHLLVQAASAIQTQAAELEAVGAGGVQALSAAPAGWKLVPVEPTKEMVAAACREHGYPGGSRAAYVHGYKSMLAASPTPPAEQQAKDSYIKLLADCRDAFPVPEHGSPIENEWIAAVGSHEAVPAYLQAVAKQQAAPKAAPAEVLGWIYEDELPESYPYSAMFLHSKVDTVRMFPVFGPTAAPGAPRWWRKRADEIEAQVALTGSPEAMRCYTDMRTLLQAVAEAAPQQEAQEPSHRETVDVVGVRSNGEHVNLGKIAMPPRMKAREIAIEQFGRFKDDDGSDAEMCFGALEYFLEWLIQQGWSKAPQPAPAPLSDDAVKDAARYRFLAGHCRSTSEHWGGRWSIVVEGPAPKSHDSEDDFDAAIDAALAAQGGKV